MKPSTIIMLSIVALVVNSVGVFLTAITHSWALLVVGCLSLAAVSHHLLRLGRELDSFYLLYSQEDKEDEEDN